MPSRSPKENRRNKFVRIYDPALSELEKLAIEDKRSFANYINRTLRLHVKEKK